MMRSITVNNKNELESTVDKYVMNGYELDFMSNQEAVVKKKRWTAGWIIGIVILLFFWILPGIILIIVRAVMDLDSIQITVANANVNNNETHDNLVKDNDSNTKFCVNCGAKIPESSGFCPECGTNLQETEEGTVES